MRFEPNGPGRDALAMRPAESFGRDRRILRRAEYLDIYASGRRYVGRWLVFFVRPSRDSLSRLGVTITKKTGSAVVRNRLRRKLRELFRRSGPQGRVDLVVNVRFGAEKVDFLELSRDFARLAGRATDGGTS